MDLTSAQKATLKANIQANPTLLAFWVDGNPGAIADYYNTLASPAYIVWRSDVLSGEIGNAWIGTDIDGMSALNMQRLQLMLQSSPQGIFDMRRTDRRAGFENPFGTNPSNQSRVNMRTVWKRSATNVEKLFATGTGTDATPATTIVEGRLEFTDVIAAMNS